MGKEEILRLNCQPLCEVSVVLETGKVGFRAQNFRIPIAEHAEAIKP